MTRLRATLTVEYDADPADYGTSSPSEMAAFDAAAFNDDPGTFLDMSGDAAIRVEVVS